MNFESKYLVRWGVPGWVLMLFLAAFYAINFQEKFLHIILSDKFSIVGFTAFEAVLGIIIGHLIHQVSICFGFVAVELIKKGGWNNYFLRELKVDKQIIELEKMGPTIKDIYSYRLGQLHARRGLLTSLFISIFLLILLIFCCGYYNKETMILFYINAFLLLVMIMNYLYFNKNLKFFMDRVRIFKSRD
ncbi:hypothetical protein [Bacillus altitudinis]|uniref:hypothetical protein n=1 Tax=Bacillus altitudinis TaxID=293387 RepID=UPI00366F3DB2